MVGPLAPLELGGLGGQVGFLDPWPLGWRSRALTAITWVNSRGEQGSSIAAWDRRHTGWP